MQNSQGDENGEGQEPEPPITAPLEPAPPVLYPEVVVTAAEKTAFLYRLQERLRLEHNDMGMELRNKIISQQEWDEFLRYWNEKNNKVVSEILAARAELKADDSWHIDLVGVFGP